jgi:hypothetical protein
MSAAMASTAADSSGALPAMVLAFVVSLFIKEIPLRGDVQTPGEAAAASPELVR